MVMRPLTRLGTRPGTKSLRFGGSERRLFVSRSAWDGRAAAVGLLADAVFGEPPAAVHPVVLFGRTMREVERRVYADRRGAGVAHAAAGVGLAALAGAALDRAAASAALDRAAASAAPAVPDRAPAASRLRTRAAATATAAYLTVAARALRAAARDVAVALDAGDLAAARTRLPALVGRDPDGLDAKEIARAVVESVAENTVDAVVAPALWAAAAGPVGAFVYRAVNTLDAMVGHRSERYERYGWASARLDDIANWVPARVTAALVCAVRPTRAGEVWRTVRADAGAHPSPNAGVAEAAFAAALGLRLGGDNRYGHRVELRPHLGAGRPPEPADIARAVALNADVAVALAVLLAAVP